MRKSLVIGLVAGVLVIAAVSAVVANTLQKDMANQTNTVQAPEEETPDQPATQAPANGTYTDYSVAKVNAAKGTKILFFHASWCPQCRALDKSIKEGQIPADTTIFKVDYDTNQVLRQQYGVTIQTTLVKIDADGKLLAKYVAYEHPTLQALIDNLL
jgi:thiol-disulfide isomerase/thioredoxin